MWPFRKKKSSAAEAFRKRTEILKQRMPTTNGFVMRKGGRCRRGDVLVRSDKFIERAGGLIGLPIKYCNKAGWQVFRRPHKGEAAKNMESARHIPQQDEKKKL